jgi:hypothetical protein
MTYEVIREIRDWASLVLLTMIWLDGRAVLAVERAVHNLYGEYIADRKEERHKKLEQLAAARAAKAAKKEAQSVETTTQN